MALLESWKYWHFQLVCVAQPWSNFPPHPQPQGYEEGCEARQMLHTFLSVLLPQSGSKVYDSKFMMFWV